jgi:hypothetical protein
MSGMEYGSAEHIVQYYVRNHISFEYEMTGDYTTFMIHLSVKFSQRVQLSVIM